MAVVISTKLHYAELGYHAWPFTGIQPQYVTNHLGWLSLLPSVGKEITTCQGTVTVLCAGKVTVGLALH